MGAIDKVKNLIKAFISGHYDAEKFSWDLQVLLAETCKEVRAEDPVIGNQLVDDWPEIVDEIEYGDPPEPFRTHIREAYEKLFPGELEAEGL